MHLPFDASRQQYASYMPSRQYNIYRKPTKNINPPTALHVYVFYIDNCTGYLV